MKSDLNVLNYRWISNLKRDDQNTPLILPAFLAEQGPGVQIMDIRPRDESTGVLGYIPGSAFFGAQALEKFEFDDQDPVPLVVVCSDGGASYGVARKIEEKGHPYVAAMAGGLAAWRSSGFATSRDPEGVQETWPDNSDVAPNSGPLTLEDVRKHVGDPRSIRWTKLASLVAQGHVSCIDGRDERGVVGSPGGDSGEFLLMLAAIERTTGKQLHEEAVEKLLLFRVDTFGHFYMHTDMHAFEALIAALSTDSNVRSSAAGVESPEDWAEFLRAAKPELWESLLKYLVDPAHIGCGHIRLMLQHSDEYGTRAELVLSFLRAIHRLWWRGSPEVKLTLLPGEHEECAILNVRLADETWGLSEIPLISPACGGRQMFVNHPEVSEFMRRRNAQAFARGLNWLGLDSSREEVLRSTVAELATQQLSVTVGYLAKGLPIFDIEFDGDGSCAVRNVS